MLVPNWVIQSVSDLGFSHYSCSRIITRAHHHHHFKLLKIDHTVAVTVYPTDHLPALADRALVAQAPQHLEQLLR